MAKKKTSKKQEEPVVSDYGKKLVITLIIIAVVVISVGQMGPVGSWLSCFFRLIFGNFYYVFMVLIAILSVLTMVIKNKKIFTTKTIIALFFTLIALEIGCCLSYGKENIGWIVFNDYSINAADILNGSLIDAKGGYIGVFLYSLTTSLVDYIGTIFIIVICAVIALILFLSTSWGKVVIHAIQEFFTLPSQLVNFDTDDTVSEEPLNVKVEPQKVRYLSDESQQPQETINNNSIFIDNNENVINDNNIEGSYIENEADDGLTILDKNKDNTVNNKKSIFIDSDDNTTIKQENDSTADLNKGSYLNTIVLDDEEDDNQDYHGNSSSDSYVNNYVPKHSNDLQFFTNEESETVDVSQQDQVQQDSSTKVEEVKPQQQTQPSVDVISTQAAIAKLANEKRKENNKDKPLPPTSGPYKICPVTLLDNAVVNKNNGVNEQAAKVKGQKLIEVLNTFGIETTLIATHIGPAVTKFEVKPEASVKVSRISNLSDNIKMELQAKTLRVEAPIPGHNAVGVEIPNQVSSMVKMKEVINSSVMKDNDSPLLFALGKNLMGEPVSCRLDKMPHLLIAGATGSGKSVCMNAIITSFLLRTHPDELKLLLIDPKKVEFTPYQDIPHLIGPVVNDPNKASNALKVIVKEMDDRYKLFSLSGVRKIADYNEYVKSHRGDGLKPLPYIVVIIDELADLMNVAGKEVETSIQRITQLARAAGIHLIVATQRPSTDVITGVIKANIPSRIAFSVSSSIDSRTILDHAGAEKLLGNGDMLYIPMGEQIPQRVQGVYVSDNEVEAICNYAKKQRSPLYADAFIQLDEIENSDDYPGGSAIEADPLYAEAKAYVIQTQKASTSLLQRRFQVGYNRAARMIEAMEQNGIIGPANGSKPREVYVKSEKDLDM